MVAPSGPRNSKVPTTVPTRSRATSTEESSRSNHTIHSGKVAASKAITSARSGSARPLPPPGRRLVPAQVGHEIDHRVVEPPPPRLEEPDRPRQVVRHPRPDVVVP